ncbi:MAG TPA: homocysteine S-methyltransferase family protein [Desulfuromonadales bacterium]|jgi:S-methylmethionine-dependent homocysteine/selenocysteine methylase|nr:homocysteine S-methyltransferase family protein [Desulfuromonadales bacterium]
MDITLLDGGLGQELLARSAAAPTGLWSTQFLIDRPELVRELHSDYFSAGADVATTNSYAILPDRLCPFGLENRFVELQRLACQLAVSARDEHGQGLVAGSMGPVGRSYRPDLAPPIEEAASLYAEIAAIQEPYVDIFLCETMSSVAQARGAVMGASSGRRPVWLAVSVDDEDGTRLRSGEAITEILPLLSEFDLAALLVNCSPPEAVSQALPLLAGQGIPLGAYANGFVKIAPDYLQEGATVDILQARKNLGPEVYTQFAEDWTKQGATIIGGCCEVGPAHIEELAKRLKPG